MKLPPRKKSEPWAGVRECFGYGAVSPQVPTASSNLDGQVMIFGQSGGGWKTCAPHGIDVSASYNNVREALVVVGSQSGRKFCEQLAAA